MKKSNCCCSCGLLIVALGFTIFSGCETKGTGASSSTSSASTMASADSGRLVIRRIPNLGGWILNVSIDGKQVRSVRKGQTYNDSLSAGPHVVSVLLTPNNLNLAPTEKRITVEKGQTYTFTAMWRRRVLTLE